LNKRVVIEVEVELHKELRKLAVLNDVKIYVLVNALLRDCLSDEERLKMLIRQLKR
jgi:collagenase-like PrtC family protease